MMGHQESTGNEAERDRLLLALRKELLGPRGGARERLNDDPRDEYVTGVLAPARSPREIEGDEQLSPASSDEEIPLDETFDQEDDSDDPLPALTLASPSLDPRSLPSSLGLSFIVTGGARIRVLFTWGRYEKEETHWQRTPHSFLTNWLDIDRDHKETIEPHIEMRLRPRLLNDGSRCLSVYLLNTYPPADYYRTQDLIFQPQIRVELEESMSIVPLSKFPGVGDQSGVDVDQAAWRTRMSYARGHLCSAVWADIDYEDSAGDSSAYGWIDGQSVPADVRSVFLRPAVRSEYIPIFEIRNPDFDWKSSLPAPVLSPDVLAEAFDPDVLVRSLLPLVEAYRDWIDREKIESERDPLYREIDSENLAACSRTADRIADGVDLLRRDATARLAFCFANRAISVQSQWQGVPLQWRPFQLAFILLNIPAIAVAGHPDRNICDLLHFPTGGGKTEAYLALTAFAMAHRRLLVEDAGDGAGTVAISRYTLRLLTIQQFRRTARLIVACEYLRVLPNHLGGVGWIPADAQSYGTVWGETRFSIGLWVGGGVTPNGLVGFNVRGIDKILRRFLGAVDILKGAQIGYDGPDLGLRAALKGVRSLEGSGAEPAQLLECPACSALLAVPEPALPSGKHVLNFLVRAPGLQSPPEAAAISSASVISIATSLSPLLGGDQAYKILSVTLDIAADSEVRSTDIDTWFYSRVLPELGADARLACARPSRMGYFLDSRSGPLNNVTDGDFAVYCPGPQCVLTIPSTERVPISEAEHSSFEVVPPPFQSSDDVSMSVRIPIRAYTVDEQVYRRAPSVVIATVDKFASLTYEPGSATLFGNVDHYHARLGYYREGAPPWPGQPPTLPQSHPPDPRGSKAMRVSVLPLAPPSLVIQDELHLIDGPLGSMVGAFETVVDALSTDANGLASVKYVASTATVSHAEAQVRSVFNRELSVFPTPGRLAGQNFFLQTEEGHPSQGLPGRLYVGVSAIGRGPQTPTVRIWSRLLAQVAVDRAAGVPDAACDPYWTAVGYFNAIRELAAARALLRADIPQRMGATHGRLDRDAVELSGRTRSLELPGVLDQLACPLPDSEAVDALVTTSMFGTGIDILRLGLMIVHGQPKSTSAYIQATGRVGRRSPAVVVTFLRASRPRDLDHYEFFCGYHRALGRWVEPVTVAPFAPRTCERTLGPMQVALLRQARELGGQAVPSVWRVEQRLRGNRFNSSARLMASDRTSPLMGALGETLEARARAQPVGRRPQQDYVRITAGNELDRWRLIAQLHNDPDRFVYREPAVTRRPTRAVVLGDPQHREADLDRVFEDSPNSLREVEDQVGVWVP